MSEGSYIHPQHLHLAVQWQLRESAFRANARVIYEHVHFGPSRLQEIKNPARRSGFSQVRRQHFDVGLVRTAQLIGHSVERIAFARNQDEFASISREAPGQLTTD